MVDSEKIQKRSEQYKQKGYKYADSPKWSLIVNYEVAGIVTKNDIFAVLYSIGKPYGEQTTLTHLSKKGKLGRISLEHFTSRQQERSRGQAIIPLDAELQIASLIGGCAKCVGRVNLYPARFRAKAVPYAELERSMAFTDALSIYAEAVSSLQQQLGTVLNKIRASTKPITLTEIAPNMWAGEDYRQRQVYLVEGRADVDRLAHMGVRNVISIDGKNLADGTINYLNSTGQIYTALFDGDRNGRQLMALIRSRIRIIYEIEVPKDAKVQSMNYSLLNGCLKNRILR